MRKIMLTRKQGRFLIQNICEVSYHLSDGFCMNLDKVRPIRNKLFWIKYYKVYIDTYGSQKDVVDAFKRLGLLY